jgi:hypothetical protein
MSETLIELDGDGTWAPQACTLPSVERPLRVAEFDALFTGSVREIKRTDQGRVRLELDPTPAVAAQAADLVVRETGCCSFFAFTLTATGGTLTLDIAVDDTHVEVLDALVAHAAAAGGQR